ncbi:MAG: S-layer homology domain-containing protein [Vulcanibacillus sp.]
MKKATFLILVIALLLTIVVYGVENDFTDVKNTDWFYDTLNEIVDKNIIDGYPDGTFKPQENISRAEFTKVIVTALELDTVEGNAFVDTEEHWAKDVINTAIENHIIDREEYGYSYEPDEKINRIEMAKMVVRALGFDEDAKSRASETTKFSDNSTIKDADKGYVIIASENGIVNGYTNNTFQPNGKATRAEAAQMLVNALKYKVIRDARTEEGYVDTSKLEQETFEEQGLSEEVKDKLTSINRATGEITYEPDKIIETDRSMLPIKFGDIIIENYYYLGYDDSILPEVYSVWWGLGGRYNMFIIEGKTTQKIKSSDYIAAFLDKDNNIVEEMHNVIPCSNFSASDEGTQKVVNAYPNMPGTDERIEANEDFTFIYLKMEKNFEQAETVVLRNKGYYGTETEDVLIFPMK